jgi:hypothetical protein
MENKDPVELELPRYVWSLEIFAIPTSTPRRLFDNPTSAIEAIQPGEKYLIEKREVLP